MSSEIVEPVVANLKLTSLVCVHIALGARMVPFAGYQMPVQYPAGVRKEHCHTREVVSLFDVSHMGQIRLRGKSRGIDQAALALEQLVPADIASLAPGNMRYTCFTNAKGGILDDLVVAHCGDHLLLVVNASRKAEDELHLLTELGETCVIEPLDDVLIALQGPQAETALANLAPDCTNLKFLQARTLNIMGKPCFVMRSGYTGEDGFEIAMPAEVGPDIVERLLANGAVAPAGLGARDSLRLEAGLPLYGSDLDETTTPIEAGLAWSIQKVRRRGGSREGGFPGADKILAQIEHGAPRSRVGLKIEGRAPVRAGALLYADENATRSRGSVTSGGFGPSLDVPIAMGYLPNELTAPGTKVFAELRGNRVPAIVTPLPFVTHRYRRG